MHRAAITIDPAWFAAEAVSPETLAFNEKLEATLAETPSLIEIGAARMRALRRSGEGPFALAPASPTAVDRTISFAGRTVPVRVFTPADGRSVGAYLHIHGGGWCLGGADMQDPALQRLADGIGITVVSVDYALAPERPFPEGPDDCEAAARWMLEDGAAELGVQRVAIGGESAGAHLTALALQRIRDRPVDGGRTFVAANLVYGCFDLAMTPSMKNWGERRLILSTPIVEWVVKNYFSPDDVRRVDLRDPRVSPLYGRLSNMPPALFTVGTWDPLVDDTMMMAARWVAAGNMAELAVFPGGVHGFDGFDLPIGAEARARQTAFLRSALEPRRIAPGEA